MTPGGLPRRKKRGQLQPVLAANKKARLNKKTAPSAHHQTLLLRKSLKKAKQFELRKLIRRLKDPAARGQGTDASETAVQRMQDKYDITKHINLEAVLQLALGKCGLVQESLTQAKPASKQNDTTSQNDITLVCDKLLSATCVRQQIEAIQKQQAQDREANTAAGQQCSKQSSLLDPVAPVHTSRHVVSAVTNEGSKEPAVACCAEASGPAVAPHTDGQTAVAATTTSALIRDDMDSGNSDAVSDVASDALAGRQGTGAMPVSTASAMLPSDAQLHLPTASQAGTQTHKGQLALKPPAAGKSCRKGETKTSATDLHGQLKPKIRKKNRLGQRARQQLGRAKEAQAVQSRPRSTFKGATPPAKASNSRQKPNALGTGSGSQNQQRETAQAVPLHPSWSAKQKQKQVLIQAVPGGSKTVFSEDGQPVIPKPTPALDSKTSRVAPVKPKQQAVPTQAQHLHPSWLAKKAAALKQAQLASCSVATKTVFED